MNARHSVDAETLNLRHPRAAGIPHGGAEQYDNRGRGDPSPPSFRGRRPWNPPVRGNAVHRRYHGITNRGILRSLTLPLNDVHKCKCSAGCVRDRGRRRPRFPPSSSRSGDPHAGQSSTLPLPRQNQPGDSRAERENDSRKCGRGNPPFPSFRGHAVAVESPGQGQRTPTVDAGGSPSPPSSSRSGDPPLRGRAPRKKYAVQNMFTIDNRPCPMI